MRRFSLFSRSRTGFIMLVLDVAVIAVIFAVVHQFHVGRPFNFASPQFHGVVALTCLTLYMFDVYRVDYNFPSFSFPVQGVAAVVVAGSMVAAIVYLLPDQTSGLSRDTIYWRGVLVVSMALFALWVAISRFLASALFKRSTRSQSWLVVGDDQIVAQLVRDFRRIRIGEQLVQLSADRLASMIGRGGEDEHDKVRDTGQWAGIVIAQKDDLDPQMLNALMQARLAGVRVYDVFDFYETFLLKMPVEFMHDQWLVMAQGFSLVHHDVQMKIKKFMDVSLASLLLLLALPVLALAALAIKLDSPGGIIFSQDRIGLNGRKFRIYKFRTMHRDADRDGERWADAKDDRVTRVGRRLRPSRVDELPQLWNVLKGDMSFVGPRPEQPEFTRRLEKEIPYFNLRVLVKPGITGWAQVQYPYGASTEDARQKLEYDLYYIKNYSILLDIAILFKTMRVILSRSGR